MYQVIPVCPRTPFTAVATATTEIPIARNLNTAGAVSAVLVAKVHAMPSAGNWLILVRNAATSSEDPGINFVDSSATSTLTITGSTQNLYHLALSLPIGEQVNVFLSTPANAATLTISVDLIIRDA